MVIKSIPKSYKPIPSFPGYYLTEQGLVVKVYDNGDIHQLSVNNKNEVTLFKDGVRYCKSLTKLFVEIALNKEKVRTKKVRGMNAKDVFENGAKYEWIEFNSLKEASEYSGVPVSYISKVINGHLYSSCGWIFEEVANV